MSFKKGNKLGGRKKGSRNKSSIFTEAFDQVYERDMGSGDGVSMFLEKIIVQLKKKLDNDNLSIDQLIALQKSIAPYYASKNTSTKSEITKTDNTISGKMVRELNESRMEIQKLKAELKEAKRKPLSLADEA
jgi:predicted RNase H-like nuclease (RuvC/YqgF family)